MRNEHPSNVLIIKGLSSGFLLILTIGSWGCIAAMLFLYFVIRSQPGDNTGPLFAIGSVVLLVGFGTFFLTKTYLQSRSAGIRINRANGAMKLQFGTKRISRRLGKFRQITAYRVIHPHPRGALPIYYAVLVGSQDKLFLRISSFTLAGIRRDTKVICQFLNINVIASNNVLHAKDFQKQFP